MSIKTTLSGIGVVIGWLFSIAIVFLWGKGIIHSEKKHSEMDSFLTYLPPWGIYRGIESYWHKYNNTDDGASDTIVWKQRIPDDIFTAYELVTMSDDVKNIDNTKMQMENFNKKIQTYPKEKQGIIKNGLKAYFTFNISATNDELDYIKKIINDSSITFSYSNLTNKMYDSIKDYYKTPEIIMFKKNMDSAINNVDFTSLPKDKLQYIIDQSNKSLNAYNDTYHLGYKNLFNEDY